VATWESRTGGPVEAAVRPPGGDWSGAQPLGGPNALGPVAAAAGGVAVVAWEGFVAGDRVVSLSVHDGGRWREARVVSRPGERATQPAAAAGGGRDTVVVGWTRRNPAAVVTVAVTPAGPRRPTVVARGDVSRLRLVTAGDGMVAAWLRDGPDGRAVEASRFDQARGWQPPTTLSQAGAEASDPVLAGGPGAVVAAWRTTDGRDGLRLVARVLDLDDGPVGDGSARWSPERTLTAGVRLPRGTARSDVGSVAPAAAVGADGTAVVAWPQRRGAVEEVLTATWSAGDGWSDARPVSRPPAEQGGSPAVAVTSGGAPVVAWESLVGDRQTVRVAGIDTGCCAALTPPGSEASAPRLAPGPDGSVTAVWVGANRGSIETADVTACG
jgi:hypothetical protein